MRPTTYALALVLLCITSVAAEKESIGYELLYFYYVYKLQYQAGGRLTMASGCKSKDLKTGAILSGVCGFADFVRYVMNPGWAEDYTPLGSRPNDKDQPFTRDNSRTPAADVETRIRAVQGAHLWQYDFDKVDTEASLLPRYGKDSLRNPNEFYGLINQNFAAVARARTGSVSDMMSALENLKLAMEERYKISARLAFDPAMEHYLTPEALRYARNPNARTPGLYYDWAGILTNIDNAVANNLLTHVQAANAKASIVDFSQNIRAKPGAAPSAMNHLAVIQTFSRIITEGQSWIDQNRDRHNTEGGNLDRCSSEDEGEATDNPFGRRSISVLGLELLKQRSSLHGSLSEHVIMVSGSRSIFARRGLLRDNVAHVF